MEKRYCPMCKAELHEINEEIKKIEEDLRAANAELEKITTKPPEGDHRDKDEGRDETIWD